VEKELDATGADGQLSLLLSKYKIEVTTGKKVLDSGNLFERKQTDVFGFQAIDLGEIKKILIGHDITGFGHQGGVVGISS